MKQMPLKVGLIGTYGYGNLGDAAIQDAVIQNVRLRFPEAEIIGFSLNPEDTEARHGIKSFPISRMSWNQDQAAQRSPFNRLMAYLRSKPQPFFHTLERILGRIPIELGLITSAYKHLAGLDALIVSGGGQLDDYWAGGGPWSHPYTLLKFGLLARLRGARYFFISVGAGPLDSRLSQRFVMSALNLAAFRSYRDESSKQLMEKIGYKQDDPIYPDLAYSLQNIPQATLDPASAEKPSVGIGPIGYFKPRCWPQPNPEVYQAYVDKLARFSAFLLQRGYQIVFLPGEAYYDQLAIGDVKARLAESRHYREDGVLRNPPIQSVDQLLEEIQKVQFVVASRFHGVLLSMLLGKPVMALSYHSKIDDLMRATGQAQYCQPIGEIDEACLQQQFIDLEANQLQAKAQIGEKIGEYRNLLDEQYERIFSLL